METVCLSIREILWKNRSQSDSFLAGKPLRCVAFTCQDLCELVALICFLAIQHIIQVLPKCESSTGLVRRRGPALSSYHIAPSFLCLHFSSDFLREPLKIVLHITDLICCQYFLGHCDDSIVFGAPCKSSSSHPSLYTYVSSRYLSIAASSPYDFLLYFHKSHPLFAFTCRSSQDSKIFFWIKRKHFSEIQSSSEF